MQPPSPRGVDYIEVDAGGVPAMWAVPKGCAEDRVLLCAHGGGYISGSMFTPRKMYAHYAKKIGCRALIVDYGLAPENRHPGPEDALCGRGFRRNGALSSRRTYLEWQLPFRVFVLPIFKNRPGAIGAFFLPFTRCQESI